MKTLKEFLNESAEVKSIAAHFKKHQINLHDQEKQGTYTKIRTSGGDPDDLEKAAKSAPGKVTVHKSWIHRDQKRKPDGKADHEMQLHIHVHHS